MKEGASRSVLRGIIQYDTLNEVNIRLSDGSKAFDYYGYTNIIFKVLKADGTSYIDSEGENVIATSPEDGIVTVILTGQATAAAGLCQSVIEIYADGEKMTTARLNYEVFESLEVDEDAVASEPDYPVLQNLMFSMENGYVTRAEKAANEAEMWAKASQDVSEGDFATRAELETVKNGAVSKTGDSMNGVLRINSEGPAARFVGVTHSYVEFYKDGTAGGRSANIGFPGAGNTSLHVTNAVEGGEIRLVCGGSVNIGQLRISGQKIQFSTTTNGADWNTNEVLHTGNKNEIFSYGTEDLTEGSSPLETGKLYFVYE